MSLLLGLLGTAVEKSILHSLSNVEHCLGFVDSFYPFFFSLKGLYQVIYHINTDLNDCLFLPLCVFFFSFFSITTVPFPLSYKGIVIRR